MKQIVLILTLSAALACGKKPYHVTRIEGKEIAVTDTLRTVDSIERFIAPYRENINKDLNTVLALSTETLDKSNGKWQTPIGNLMADVALEFGNRIFTKRVQKTIDMSILNFGGIRSIIPKGQITTKTAFEIMPFENSLVVAEMTGSQITEIVNYIIREKKAHPISGISFVIDKDKQPQDIRIGGQPLDMTRIYYVVTSDYLINGGDNMTFFQKSAKTYELNYKLRTILIDYFKEVDTIPIRNDIRITELN